MEGDHSGARNPKTGLRKRGIEVTCRNKNNRQNSHMQISQQQPILQDEITEDDIKRCHYEDPHQDFECCLWRSNKIANKLQDLAFNDEYTRQRENAIKEARESYKGFKEIYQKYKEAKNNKQIKSKVDEEIPISGEINGNESFLEVVEESGLYHSFSETSLDITSRFIHKVFSNI